MNPKEKLPLETNNMNTVSFRPETINITTEDTTITSREAGNEVKKAIQAYEEKLAAKNNFQ